jgi:AbrB family looped-hinge helix DNA binding protein
MSGIRKHPQSLSEKHLLQMLTDKMGNEMAKEIEINRQEPLELDSRGRVTIPSNIREKHGIQPGDDRTIWVEVTIESAEIEYDDEDDGGEGSE